MAYGVTGMPRASRNGRNRPVRLKQAKRTANFERSEEHTSELQSPCNLVCRLLLEKKKLIRQLHHLPQRLAPREAQRGERICFGQPDHRVAREAGGVMKMRD